MIAFIIIGVVIWLSIVIGGTLVDMKHFDKDGNEIPKR